MLCTCPSVTFHLMALKCTNLARKQTKNSIILLRTACHCYYLLLTSHYPPAYFVRINKLAQQLLGKTHCRQADFSSNANPCNAHCPSMAYKKTKTNRHILIMILTDMFSFRWIGGRPIQITIY